MHRVSLRSIGQCLRAQKTSSHTLRGLQNPYRQFHVSAPLAVVKPYLLADIGEGITECQIIQWFVEPGATVEQFDKICEVQSDKATVEITSRFDGVIKKRYYEADDMAKVGKPLVDIDIKGELSPEDEALVKDPERPSIRNETSEHKGTTIEARLLSTTETERDITSFDESRPLSKHATLATPAVRHMIKERNLDITRIQGTGKDGRVLKEDVQKHAAGSHTNTTPPSYSLSTPPTPLAEDKTLPLTAVQSQMFKTMTRSLSIPHFLYTDTVSFTSLTPLRRKLNATRQTTNTPTLSSLPFIIKAVSLALEAYPLLNAHLDTTSNTSKPHLIQKAAHNIGIAIDSPAGLLVPVLRNVQAHTITSLAAEIHRLSSLARAGKLSSADLTGATFTISNIGSIGGTAVAPVIVPPQVGILGIGRSRVVPAFGENGELVRREECVFSWSADHRVIDGAMAARCAEMVRGYLEDVETMLVRLR
ncbi:branched-chain alpha-keto acid dehydrogenase E2 component [Pseudovirgaria hyperparasitica]|uniref:Dihydrolipoamide acetyltransferase component of pyruvate dehydrogenase complex n=1 Tax=Pseudovirgaria hyperparasitica TaxID=470096 RepID=A0A6A6WHT4_9PEZI|nr:branched-chain alpha-keto acid dehydrogenase E2 component [Pseudovirgaria hyperparasitica]KAF2761556.1 branched-chain alpha-keto acid dehydrogenase E2 component [Pseudovirgaria hyperparasitica]